MLLAWGGDVPPMEENAELLGFTPECAHLLLQGVYGDLPHHKDGSHLYGRITDDALCQRCWRRIAAQSASWYDTSSGAVGRCCTAILAAEWRGILGRSWNYERPLVFSHVVLTKTLCVRRAQEIRARLMRCMDLWERGIHAGLLGDAKVEGAAREGRSALSGEEEDEAVARSYHNTVISGNICQAVCQVTDREGRGCLLPDDQCTNNRQLVADIFWDKHLNMHVPPVENFMCAAFKEYEEMQEMVPLDFT